MKKRTINVQLIKTIMQNQKGVITDQNKDILLQ